MSVLTTFLWSNEDSSFWFGSYCLIKFWESAILLPPRISEILPPSIDLPPQPTGQIWLDLYLLR